MDSVNNLHIFQPLLNPSSIRLIRLLPNEIQRSRVHVELFETSLEYAPSYEALSYVWGIDHSQHFIHVDKWRIKTTSNCEAALQQLRFRDEARILWIDALCINQDSVMERNQQVGIMGAIYQTAKRVLIWLGEGTPDSDLAMELLAKFETVPDENLEQERFSMTAMQKWQDYIGVTDPDHILNDICDRPWFQRSWTIQEAALGREVLVLCGSRSLLWNSFIRAVKYLQWHAGSMERSVRVSKPTGLWNAAARLRNVMSLHEGVSRLVSGDSLDWIPIGAMLNEVYQQTATEPQDRVFAMCGIMQALNISFPAPDYRKSLEQVYVDAALAAIIHDQSLAIWSRITGQEELASLPTWVPRFSNQLPPIRLFANKYSATKNERFGTYSFEDEHRKLVLTGKRIDRIASRSQMSWDRGITRGMFRARDEIYKQMMDKAEEKHITQMLDWVQMFIKLKSHLSHAADEFMKQSFLRLLVQDKAYVDSSAETDLPEEHALEWYNLLRAEHTDIEKPASETETSEWLTLSTGHVPPEYPQSILSDQKSKERRIWESISQHPSLRAFNSQTFALAQGRAFFITERDRIGTAPDSTAIGDIIVLITGHPVPVILRPEPRPGHFKLIGEAFVQGAMYGELWSSDKKSLAQFSIV